MTRCSSVLQPWVKFTKREMSLALYTRHVLSHVRRSATLYVRVNEGSHSFTAIHTNAMSLMPLLPSRRASPYSVQYSFPVRLSAAEKHFVLNRPKSHLFSCSNCSSEVEPVNKVLIFVRSTAAGRGLRDNVRSIISLTSYL